MELHEKELLELIAKGNAQGYLTYDDVNDYLPDEDVSPEKLDNLLLALEEIGIELVDEAPEDSFEDAAGSKGPSAEEVQKQQATEPQLLPTEELPKLSDDPIRMYFSQMAEISLLKREEEISPA